jgi:anti-anti-sigma factor
MSQQAATITDQLGPEGAYVISVVGEFDLALSEEAESAVGRAFETEAPIMFDLEACRFIDSSAIRIFAMAARRAEEDGRKIVVAAQDSQISRVFELTRLSEVVPLIGSCDEALQQLGLSPGEASTDAA